MNEELQTAIAELITNTIEVSGNVKDFITAETPEFITQLLTYYAVASVLRTIAATVVTIVIYKLMKFTLRMCETTEGGYATTTVGEKEYHDVAVFNIIWVIALIIPTLLVDFTFIKIWLAPKLFLVEYAAKLM